MHTLPLRVSPDPNDVRACQVFVDVVADGVPVRMLVDTGTPRTSIPHRDPSPGGGELDDGAGGESSETLARLETLQWGSLTVAGVVASMEPPGWLHPPLLGRDTLGSHACHFRFTDGVLELRRATAGRHASAIVNPAGRDGHRARGEGDRLHECGLGHRRRNHDRQPQLGRGAPRHRHHHQRVRHRNRRVTAETRAGADRARSELSIRGVDVDQLEDHTTTEDWLAAHAEQQRVDDTHRDITDEHELADVVDARAADLTATFPEVAAGSAVAEPADIRATSEPLPPLPEPGAEDWTRVPTPDETAQAVDRARVALAELHRRRLHDQQREAEDAHAEQVTRWRTLDRDTAPTPAADHALTSGLD